MTETGTVVKTEEKYAVIKVDKKDECSKCGMCLFPKNASSIEIRAKNRVGAKIGDTVLFKNEGAGKTLSAVLVFLVPLVLIIAAAVIGVFVIEKEIWILFLSLIFIVSWYTVLGFFDKKLRKSDKFCAEIVEILSNGENENDKNNG